MNLVKKIPNEKLAKLIGGNPDPWETDGVGWDLDPNGGYHWVGSNNSNTNNSFSNYYVESGASWAFSSNPPTILYPVYSDQGVRIDNLRVVIEELNMRNFGESDAIDLMKHTIAGSQTQASNMLKNLSTGVQVTAGVMDLTVGNAVKIGENLNGATKITAGRMLQIGTKSLAVVGLAANGIEMAIGISDGEMSEQDWMTAGALIFGVASIATGGVAGVIFGAVSIGFTVFGSDEYEDRES